MPDRFEKHARTVTLLTFLSRLTGLARDAALSRVFGVSALTDAFWFAFMIPNLFRRLFGEGALSAAFLPVYTQLDKDDVAIARRLATLTLSWMVIALGGLTVIGELVLLGLSMRGESQAGAVAVGGENHFAIRMMMIMLPYMPMVCMVAILGAALQVHGRFGPTAAAPIVLNFFLVGAAVGFVKVLDHHDPQQQKAHLMLVSCAVIAAGIVQLIWSVWSLRRSGDFAPPHWRFGDLRFWRSDSSIATSPDRQIAKSMKRVLTQAWPMFIGLGVLQVNTFIDGLVASYPTTVGPTIFGVDFPLDAGALTALQNAARLYEFPLGVFGIAIATAIFPALSRVGGNGDGDREAFADILRRGLRLVIYIGLPASVGLMLVREPLTAAILQGKNFTPADTQRVAFILLGYAPAIWAYSMTHTLTRAFHARGDSKTPVKVACAIVILNFGLNVTLIWTPLKEAGLAWSTAIAAIVQVFILLRLTRRYAAHVVNADVTRSWMKTIAVTAAMAAVVAGADAVLSPSSSLAGTWRWAVLRLVVLVGLGAGTVLGASVVLRMKELGWAMGRSEQ